MQGRAPNLCEEGWPYCLRVRFSWHAIHWLDFADEIGRADIQLMRQAKNNVQRYVELAALNFPISRPLDAGLLSKIFLRNSLSLSQSPEPISKF